jgi:hypothetical protein
MSTTTTGKTTCPLCAAPGCSYGDDDRAFLLCPNPNCPPNARHGSISDWYVSGDEEILIREALWGEGWLVDNSVPLARGCTCPLGECTCVRNIEEEL